MRQEDNSILENEILGNIIPLIVDKGLNYQKKMTHHYFYDKEKRIGEMVIKKGSYIRLTKIGITVDPLYYQTFELIATSYDVSVPTQIEVTDNNQGMIISKKLVTFL